MTIDQMTLLRTAVAEIRTVSVAAPQPHSADSLSDLLQKQGIKNASIDVANLSATGFSDAGIAAIGSLARSFRPSLSTQSQMASNATLGRFIAGEIVSRWKGRTAASLGTGDLDDLRKAVESWFAAQNMVRRHVVPCTLFPLPLESFSIGPVTFCHVQGFPSEEFGVPKAEFWPKPPPGWGWRRWLQNVWAAIRGKTVAVAKLGGFKLEHFLDFGR
jgi:hypothetical protein